MTERCNTTSFCAGWKRFSGRDSFGKGLCEIHLISLKTGKLTERLPAYRPLTNKDGVMLNFCPWCGASFEPMRDFKGLEAVSE